MVDLPLRMDRNKLRQVVMKAEGENVMTKEEAGFVITLVERFRADIEKKIKTMNVISGEINQLKVNEQVIINLIENMVSSAERDLARQETMKKLKGSREVEVERNIKRKKNAKKDSKLAEELKKDK